MGLLELPRYPRVEARGTAIFVVDEEGREIFWGEEENELIAKIVAEKIQTELRAINYVKHKLTIAVNSLMDDLIELGVSTEHLDDIIFEGYSNLKKILLKLGR
jgi:hypothetical protein